MAPALAFPAVVVGAVLVLIVPVWLPLQALRKAGEAWLPGSWSVEQLRWPPG